MQEQQTPGKASEEFKGTTSMIDKPQQRTTEGSWGRKSRYLRFDMRDFLMQQPSELGVKDSSGGIFTVTCLLHARTDFKGTGYGR